MSRTTKSVRRGYILVNSVIGADQDEYYVATSSTIAVSVERATAKRTEDHQPGAAREEVHKALRQAAQPRKQPRKARKQNQ